MAFPPGLSQPTVLDDGPEPRVRLEPLEPGHAVEMIGVLDDARLHEFIGGRPPTAEELGERFRRQSVGRSSDGTQLWLNWVVRQVADGVAVGTLQATVSEADGQVIAEVAWVIGTEFQGRGLARTAAGAMAAWLREQGVETVLAHVHPDHPASQGVARSLGLQPTTTMVDGEVRWQG